MDLLWVRHGEPERIAPGTGVPADPALTELGREQAQRLADWLAFEPIDAVLSSPMRRAVDTAADRRRARARGRDRRRADRVRLAIRPLHPDGGARRNKDERWLAMIEGRWESFGADPPDVFRGSTRSSTTSSNGSPGSGSSRCVTAASSTSRSGRCSASSNRCGSSRATRRCRACSRRAAASSRSRASTRSTNCSATKRA